MELNYAIILLGYTRIEGWVDDYDWCVSNPSIRICIDGAWYRTGANNVLLMHKDKNE